MITISEGSKTLASHRNNMSLLKKQGFPAVYWILGTMPRFVRAKTYFFGIILYIRKLGDCTQIVGNKHKLSFQINNDKCF